MNKIPITQSQFDELVPSNSWKIVEMSLDSIKGIPKVARPEDHLGAFVSGSAETQILNGFRARGGIDLLTYEKNPDFEAGEGHVNAYHYVFAESGREDFPFFLAGPLRDGTLVGHWPKDLGLECYTPSEAE